MISEALVLMTNPEIYTIKNLSQGAAQTNHAILTLYAGTQTHTHTHKPFRNILLGKFFRKK